MVTLERPYKLDTGTAQCTNCGANIRKYYMGINDHRPVCSKCVNGVFNLDVPQQELLVPIWLVQKANKYVLHRLYLQQYRGNHSNSVTDFVEGFLDERYLVFSLKVTKDTHHINGKAVRKAWLTAIQNHLHQKYLEIKEDEQKSVRKLLVCGNCKKPLYFKGVLSSKDTKYSAYHCLTGKICMNSNSSRLFAHYGGNRIKLIR